MQQGFDFAAADLTWWKAALIGRFGDPLPVRRRSPLGQLVKSMLSGRTRDAVSKGAYDALVARFPEPRLLAAASVAQIESIVAPVTFAHDKAVHLSESLALIERERTDFDLAFLARPPLADALAWLERLPGVARKVSASTLNASTMARPVLIVDTHVLRVLQRLGFVGELADYRVASQTVTAGMPGWSGDDFLTFHILSKRLGQLICRWDKPECGRCPLAANCLATRQSGVPAPAWSQKLTARLG